jgi:TonB family protein
VNSESEIRKAWERDRAYYRRLIKLIPVAFAVVLFLFLTSDQVSIREIEKHVGWKGEMRLLPDITIMPDDDPFSAIESQHKLKLLTIMDLDVVDGPDFDKPKLINNDSPDQTDMPALSVDDLLQITTRPSRRDVPYSENYIILKMVEPEYPIYELENGIEGSVTVELFVNENGTVDMASVLSSIGPKSFAASSLKAVKQFVFQPPTRGGKPSSMWIKFLIKFRIYG